MGEVLAGAAIFLACSTGQSVISSFMPNASLVSLAKTHFVLNSRSDPDIYTAVMTFLRRKEILSQSSFLSASTGDGVLGSETEFARRTLAPGEGFFDFVLSTPAGRRVTVQWSLRILEGTAGSLTGIVRELSLSCWHADADLLWRCVVLQASIEAVTFARSGLRFYSAVDGAWAPDALQEKRSLDSVALPDGVDRVVSMIERVFLNLAEPNTTIRLRRLNVLMTGVPGSGKNSIVNALASRFDVPVYVLKLSSRMLSGSMLDTLVKSITAPKFFLLIDDFEVAWQPGRSDVSEADLRNFLDGVLCPAGRMIVFILGNDRAAIGPILSRPMRIHADIDFGAPTLRQVGDMTHRWAPALALTGAQLATLHPLVYSLAELQSALLFAARGAVPGPSRFEALCNELHRSNAARAHAAKRAAAGEPESDVPISAAMPTPPPTPPTARSFELHVTFPAHPPMVLRVSGKLTARALLQDLLPELAAQYDLRDANGSVLVGRLGDVLDGNSASPVHVTVSARAM